jgi:cyclophilin family peptidyl-prolyl cis-trans isomerase
MLRCLAAWAALAPAAAALGQLVPERTYYGINRAIPMTVRVPAEAKGEVQIQLLAPVTAEVKATASVVAGRVDLAGLFPSLWRPAPPPTPRSLVYAQLVVGGAKIGPAVVLQPLLEPPYCVFMDSRTGEPTYRDARVDASGRSLPAPYSGLRAYVEKHIVMETTLGDIEFQLRPDEAPNTAWNFLELCDGGFYTDIQFHRIVAMNPSAHAPFVIQAGDPIRGHSAGNPDPGDGGPGYLLNLEPSRLPHDFGVLSMARSKQPNSAGSQFFIGLSREGTAVLDGQYCAFGQAVAGADTILKIAAVPTDAQGRAADPPVIKRCRVVDAPPHGQGPSPVKASSAAPVAR